MNKMQCISDCVWDLAPDRAVVRPSASAPSAGMAERAGRRNEETASLLPVEALNAGCCCRGAVVSAAEAVPAGALSDEGVSMAAMARQQKRARDGALFCGGGGPFSPRPLA